ncbi:MAG TPA: S-layer homology domain-containing protein [Symbiobacteriaceae bacterium]|nr:S-layer homology domain-containing protein [Symbiobacteriaceae bacterium]
MTLRRRLSAGVMLLPLISSLLLVGTSAAAETSPAPTLAPAAAARHWAAPAVDELVARLAWSAPTDLEAPIPRDEWYRLVSRAVGEQPDKEREMWVWNYTGGLAGDEFLMRREDAIGGLMKLASMVHGEKANSAHPSALDSFGDGAKVSDRQRALVAGALKLGLVTGYPDGMLYPTRPLTYGEAAVLVSRFLDRYGGPAKSVSDPQLGMWPRTRPFAAGLEYTFGIDQIIHSGFSVGSAGSAWLVINGAAWATELPGLGAAPEGQVWVAVDTEIYNWERAEVAIAPDSLRFTLQDAGMKVNIRPATPTPFEKTTVVLKQRESLRGFVVFAVPAGMQGLWFQCESKLGLAPGKGDGYNGASRGFLGNLPV